MPSHLSDRETGGAPAGASSAPARPATNFDHRANLDPEMTRELEAFEAKDLTKEAAVKHERHWVRLTRLCNQRCIFCLDAWNHNGTYVDTHQLLQYIELGKKLGRERLILSGGEPTIHPDYVKFIRHGKKVGYDWVQTVTNGMMFAYPEFTRKVLAAGLDEVTMSIHGHTPRIQDRLVGVKGAFDKAVQGIRNIRAASGGRTVINIDVVVNKQNVEHLRDIIDFFRGMDIHEFDLLYLVPFGRGFAEYRSQLFFDLADHHEDLQRALEPSREPGVFIWTNRLPPEHLEGYEDLIQDPHKLHSEVQGGLHNFEGYMKLGAPPDCYGERCDFCFLKGLCHDHMFAYGERLSAGTFERVRIDLDLPPESDLAAEALHRQRPAFVHVEASTPAAIRSWLGTSPFRDVEGLRVTAGAKDEGELASLLEDAALDRVSVTTAAGLEGAVGRTAALLAAGADPASLPDLEVHLARETVAWILSNEAALAPAVACGKVVGRLPNHEFVSEVRDGGVGPAEIEALRQAGLRLMNVPRCLGGERSEPGAHYELSADLLDAKGKMKVTPYVQRYILGEYYKKSVRCRGCAFDADCKGMHMQFLRAHGFRVLKPVPASPS